MTWLSSQKLSGDRCFQELQKKDGKGCQQLMKEIVDRSDGVFLWATLVLKSLLDELENRASLPKLQQKLNSMPTELEKFLGVILESIDEPDRKEAYCTFAICVMVSKFRRHPPLSLFRFSFLADILEDTEFAVKQPIRDMTEKEINDRLADATVRLSRCCKGLLELQIDRTQAESRCNVPLVKVFEGSLKFTCWPASDILQNCIQTHGAKYLNDVDLVKVFSQLLVAQIKSVPLSTDEGPTREASYELAYRLTYELAYVVDSVLQSELENEKTCFGLIEALDKALLLRQQTTCPDFQDVRWSKYYALLPWDMERYLQPRVAFISMLHIAVYVGF